MSDFAEADRATIKAAVMNASQQWVDRWLALHPVALQRLDLSSVTVTDDRAWRSSTAGQYRRSTLSIRMNLIVCHSAERYEATLYHEAAHALAFWSAPRSRPHGKEWREIMAALGRPVERGHRYADPQGQPYRFRRHRPVATLTCLRCAREYPITARRVKSIKRGRVPACWCGGGFDLVEAGVIAAPVPLARRIAGWLSWLA